MTAYSAELPKLEGECYLPLEEHSVIKVVFSEFPGGLSILSCHCYGSGRYCGTGSTPGLGTSMPQAQPKMLKNKNIKAILSS